MDWALDFVGKLRKFVLFLPLKIEYRIILIT